MEQNFITLHTNTLNDGLMTMTCWLCVILCFNYDVPSVFLYEISEMRVDRDSNTPIKTWVIFFYCVN